MMQAAPCTEVRRVLIVEDLPHVRRGLASAIERAFPGAVVDEVHDLLGGHARLSQRESYHVALIDLGLPDGSGLDLIREVRRRHPSTLAVVTTIFDDDEHVFSAIAAGADGYLLKEHPPAVLTLHLKLLEQGLPALSPTVARRILGYFRGVGRWPRGPARGRAEQASTTVAACQITARETDVLSLIGRGFSRGEVAQALSISENTVAKYLKDIYRKLNISSRAEAALEAHRRGLV